MNADRLAHALLKGFVIATCLPLAALLIAILIAWGVNDFARASSHMDDHYGPGHWYPTECCSRRDCKPIPDDAVEMTSEGYRLYNGDLIPYGDRKERQSLDGRYHRCSRAYDPSALESARERDTTICLFVPGRST